jgi:molybdopterin-guanine dinucleotide biosynthesis protein A
MDTEKKYTAISVIVLAGGRSSRIGLGKDKGYLKFRGTILIKRVILNILSLEGITEQDIIIVGPRDRFPQYKLTVEDIYPQKGPLGGIFSGLQYSKTFYNLVIGYDMPFIEKRLVEYMIENMEGYDIVIPTHGKELFEPLCAIYSKNCLKIIKQNLKKGTLAIRDIFPFLKIRRITEMEIRRCDPELHSFFNINFQGDFIEAEKLEIDRRKKNVNK